MADLMLEAVLSVVVALAGIIGVVLANHFRKDKETDTKYEVVLAVVLAVQQVYKNLDGESKYLEAVRWITERFKRLGLEVDPQEVDLMVEEAVKRFKLEFGERWYEG